MNRQFSSLLKKTLLAAGAVILGWTARAQSTSNNMTSDTTHPHMMHHRWNGNRPGGDSTAKRDGFHRGGGFQGGQEGWRGHDGQNGWRGNKDQDGYAMHRPGGEGHNRPGGEGHGRFGQGRGRFGHGRGGEFARFTPEQRQQMMAINKDYHQKAEDLFKQDNLTLKQYKAGLIALQKEKKAKIQGLLTPLQKDEVTLQHKKREDEGQLRADERLEHLRQTLHLTDDQVSKIKAGQESLRSPAQAIHENDNLLPQDKREQMKALMAKRNDTFKSVLTPDQYTRFQQLMSHRRPGGPGGNGGPWQGHRPGGNDDGK